MENKNTLIGSVLLGILVIAMFWQFNQAKKNAPPAAKSQTAQNQAPSQSAKADTNSAAKSTVVKDTTKSAVAAPLDSAAILGQLGPFAPAAKGTEKEYVIENEVQKITISSKGGAIKSVQLKKYVTWDKKPLMLFTGKTQQFSYQFFISGNRSVDTKDLYFEPIGGSFEVKGNEEKSITFRLKAADGEYFEQKYSLKGDDYHVGYDVNMVGFDKIITTNKSFQLTWTDSLQTLEHSVSTERRYSALYYKYGSGEVANLDENKDKEQEALTSKADWISFKQQFFNASIFGKGLFTGKVKADYNKDDQNYVKKYDATLFIDYNQSPTATYAMGFYFGPNRYSTLKKAGDDFESIIKLSPDNFVFNWIKYITKFAIIPVFNILDAVHLNYGIIILILTILLKLVLTPLTWKAIKSGAFMKVLKPEIDALKTKYGDDTQKISAEQMKIYQKAGVSPFGGCLPMLLQMPILLSMYYFFPNSIELRQQPFLWATDLSSYDSILNFATPIFGQDHLSLFTILMTLTSILSAVYNQNQSGMANQQPGMKYMPYIMPVMLMFMFNSFPAALTYYYLLQNVLTVAQQWIMQKFFIDEAALHRKIEENKKNPAKKSGLMKRLEDIQRQAEVQKNQAKKK